MLKMINSIFFFKETRTLNRKKIVQKPPYNRAGCIVEPINASRQPKLQFCQTLVKVVKFMCARGPAPHVARGRKHCKRMVSLYKHMGKLQRAITLILRCESKVLKVKSAFDPFCTPVQKLCSQVLPVPPELIY